MSRFIGRAFVTLFVLLSSFEVRADQQTLLQIPWPPGWEYQPPNLVNGVWYMQARRANDATQLLRLTIVQVPESAEAITNESLRSLVTDLAALSKSDTRAFSTGNGYYFVARDNTRATNAQHFAEGVLLRDGYLLRITLYADDLESDECAGLVAAIAQATFSTPETRN